MVRQPPPGKQPSRSSGKPRTARRASARPAARRDGASRQDPSQQAIAVYERAVKALQRRRYAAAAAAFQQVIDKFPNAPEIRERSQRHLAACERAAQPAPTPATVEDRLYAATIALNSGFQKEALQHLNACLKERPDSDHVQYMLAVARADADDLPAAATHLLRAIELNSDNRFLARTEPSFDRLREDDAVRTALGTPDADPHHADSESPAPR